MAYKIGQWKKSTLITLNRVKKENDNGNNPKAAFFRNGAISAWLTILKKHRYLDNGDGYRLNSRGLYLLEELRKNPPKSTRKKANSTTQNIPDVILKDSKNNLFVVEIKGQNDFNVKSVISNVTEEKILRALAVFKEELK